MQNSNKKLLLFNMDESKVALIRTLCANLNVKLIKYTARSTAKASARWREFRFTG